MPIPFTDHPARTVPASGLPSVRWTVTIGRADTWPGWRWLDRLEGGAVWEAAGALGAVPVVLQALTLPAITARRLAYRLRRRTDWDVCVYAGPQEGHRPGEAVFVKRHPTQAGAVAEALWSHLDRDDRLPPATTSS